VAKSAQNIARAVREIAPARIQLGKTLAGARQFITA